MSAGIPNPCCYIDQPAHARLGRMVAAGPSRPAEQPLRLSHNTKARPPDPLVKANARAAGEQAKAAEAQAMAAEAQAMAAEAQAMAAEAQATAAEAQAMAAKAQAMAAEVQAMAADRPRCDARAT